MSYVCDMSDEYIDVFMTHDVFSTHIWIHRCIHHSYISYMRYMSDEYIDVFMRYMSDEYMYATWLIYICDMTHSYMLHNPIFMCNHMLTSQVAHRMGHITLMNASCHIYKWVELHTWMRHLTHVRSHVNHKNVSCHTYECVMLHI